MHSSVEVSCTNFISVQVSCTIEHIGKMNGSVPFKKKWRNTLHLIESSVGRYYQTICMMFLNLGRDMWDYQSL